MGFEHYIELGCENQRGRQGIEFMRRAKLWGLCGAVREMYESGAAPDKPLDEQVIHAGFPVRTLFGVKTTLTYKELHDTWERIERKALPHCRDCSCNHRERALGCYDVITYPISAAGEEWLMEQLDPPDGDDGYVPYHISVSHVTGEGIDAKRGGGGQAGTPGFVMRRQPARKRILGVEYTSSQVLEYMLGCQPAFIRMSLLGFLADFRAIHLEKGQMAMLVVDETTRAMGEEPLLGGEPLDGFPFRLRALSSDDQSIAQFKRFFLAMHKAFVAKVPLWMDG